MTSDTPPAPARPKSSVLLLLAIVFLLAVVLPLCLLRPQFIKTREVARMSQCLNNLKQIGLMMNTYSQQLGLPKSVDDLRRRFPIADPNTFKCPGDTSGAECSYIDLTPPIKTLQPNTIIAREELGNHPKGGISCLYADGHVKFMKEKQKTIKDEE